MSGVLQVWFLAAVVLSRVSRAVGTFPMQSYSMVRFLQVVDGF